MISKIRKELENYNHRLQSGTDENRQKQRSLQLERNIRQTEEATAVLEVQLDTLETVPEEEMAQWSAQKAEFERELELLNSAKEELASARSEANQEVQSLQSELNLTVQKRERLQSRRTRLNEQYERIISANAQGLNERERRAAEQFAREQDHAKLEATFQEQFNSITHSVQDHQMRISHLWQQASSIEQSIQQHQQQMLLDTGPLTPEGNLPGTNPPLETSESSTTTALTGRSLLALSFPPARSSPLQNVSSLVDATSSQPASPAQTSFPPQLPVSPFGNSYFGSDVNNRDRSFSNRSARSSQNESEFFDASNRLPSHQVDLSELLAEQGKSSGSDGNGSLSHISRPVLSPFQRAASRGSGTASGSGGSGSGSGHSSPAHH